jgi:hypothetical protein
MPRATQRGSGLAIPDTATTHDINHPQYRAAAVARITRFGLEGSPQQRTVGKGWYGLGHEAVRANQGDLGFRTAAGVASALSPGSDWEKANIPSIAQSQALTHEDWSLIHDTYHGGWADIRGRKARGENVKPGASPRRHAEVSAMLAERAPTLASSSDSQLLKVHSMLHQGVDPEDAMPRYGNPKTHAFFHGLLNPNHTQSHLAIDYKMADMVSNEMRPTQAYRGLGKGYSKRGDRKTSYQHHEDIIRMAGQAMHLQGGRSFAAFAQSPLKAQAYVWSIGKDIEQSHPERKMSQQRPGETFTGPARRGQPYMSPSGSHL